MIYFRAMKGPSKNVTVIFILVVLIMIGIIAFSARKQYKENIYYSEDYPATLSAEQTNNIEELDSDGDGLFDWEEILRKTDPTNPDSDGDGTIDGTEVKEGRDPAVAGPDDAISTPDLEQLDPNNIPDIYEHYTDGTISAQLANNFYRNYFEYGGAANYATELEPALIATLIDGVDDITDLENKYSALELQTFFFNKEQVREYGNEFAEIQKSLLEQLGVLQNNSPESYLNSISTLYHNTSERLMDIEVPKSLSELHTEVANNFYKVGISISQINTEYQTDPIKSLFAIQNYNTALASQIEIYTTIANYFKDNDILFDEDEAGIFWSNILLI